MISLGVGRFTRAPGLLSICLILSSLGSTSSSQAQEESLEVVRIQPGDQYRVSTREKLEGYLDLPDGTKEELKRFPLTGTASVRYVERAISKGPEGKIERALRVYNIVDSQRKVGDQDQKAALRDAVRRIALHRRGAVEVPYSPDGPLQWSEVLLLAQHLFVPVLEDMLPSGPMAKGASWDMPAEATLELTGLDQLEGGKLTCQYAGMIEHKGKPLGQIQFEGTVVGGNRQGRFRDAIRGAAYVDGASRRFQSLRAVGTREVLGDKETLLGKLNVDFQMVVTPLEPDALLADNVVNALPSSPGPAQTALVYVNSLLGVRLVHPRKWEIVSAVGNQIQMSSGSGSLVLTIEPDGKAMPAAEYQRSVFAHLQKNKHQPRETLALQQGKGPFGELATFQYAALDNYKPMVLVYWSIQSGVRGATLAGRLPEEGSNDLLADIQLLAYNVELLPPADVESAPPKSPATTPSP
jgi:hypothetical protein